MSTRRSAQTIVITLVRDDENSLGQLRIAGVDEVGCALTVLGTPDDE